MLQLYQLFSLTEMWFWFTKKKTFCIITRRNINIFLIKNVKHEIQHIFLTVRGRKVQYVCAIVRSNFLNISFRYKNKYLIFWIMILMFFVQICFFVYYLKQLFCVFLSFFVLPYHLFYFPSHKTCRSFLFHMGIHDKYRQSPIFLLLTKSFF